MVTNRLDWEKALDPHILSLLKSDLISRGYDALDLYEILRLTVEKASDVSEVKEGRSRWMAACASLVTGDAREAVDLLVKPANVAEDRTGELAQNEVEVTSGTLEVGKTEGRLRHLRTRQSST